MMYINDPSFSDNFIDLLNTSIAVDEISDDGEDVEFFENGEDSESNISKV